MRGGAGENAGRRVDRFESARFKCARLVRPEFAGTAGPGVRGEGLTLGRGHRRVERWKSNVFTGNVKEQIRCAGPTTRKRVQN